MSVEPDIGWLGAIYSLSAREPGTVEGVHPHVVALEFADEVLLIPAFSVDGVWVHRKMRQAAAIIGIEPSLLGVTLDNAQHVAFRDSRQGKVAVYLLARREKVSKRSLGSATRIGQMDEAGVKLLAEGLLRLAEAKPEDFSSAALKKLRKITGATPPS